MLLIFAILLTIGSTIATFLVVGANAMSSAPQVEFQGGLAIIAVCAFTALLWAGWIFDW
jgi:hypothetical protein